MLRLVSVLLLLTPLLSMAQKPDRRIIKALQTDVAFLASHASPESEGERKAADYLVARYEKLKIPAYGNAYRHSFSFVHGIEMNDSRVVLGGQSDQLGGEAFPLPFSGNGSVSGEVLIEVQEQGAIWLLPLYENAADAADPAFDWQQSAWRQARQAINDGATGIVFYDNQGSTGARRFDPLCPLETLTIPVTYVGHRQWQDLSAAGANVVSVSLDIRLSKPERTAINVIARVDNKAAQTIVIAANLDRVVVAEHGGSGDNAPGTAALLQLAEGVKKSPLRNYNLIFAHLAGGRMGQAGAAALRKELASGKDHISAVIDLYMIGRLSEAAPEVRLSATPGFPEQQAIHALFKKAGFRETDVSPGCGAPNGRVFEASGIPVLVVSGPSCESGTDVPRGLNYAAEARLISALQATLRQLSAGLQH